MGEGDGEVMVCVQLVGGHLSWPVTFRLSTADGSAYGTTKQHCYAFHACIQSCDGESRRIPRIETIHLCMLHVPCKERF